MIYDGKRENLPKEIQELLTFFDKNIVLMCTSTYCSVPIFDEKASIDYLKNKNSDLILFQPSFYVSISVIFNEKSVFWGSASLTSA